MKTEQRRICGGIFTPDPDIPADPYSKRRTCRCGLTGAPGDAHHTPPDAPDGADHGQRAAGEGAAR